jgi:predicted outer membrane protein
MKNLSESNQAYAKLCGRNLDVHTEYKNFRELYSAIAPHLVTGFDMWNFSDQLTEFSERLNAIYTMAYPDTDDPELTRYLVGIKHKLDTFKSMRQRIS